MKSTAEGKRLFDEREGGRNWKKWGSYLSERQWGTVREDYSENGDAWNHFTHDQARSRAYRWGEDGIGGICDDRQLLCFAPSFWNGKDTILKERLFGLTNTEGNHGEDVKEYYFHIDNTPTHSYMKYLYKYPQAAYPYEDLVATNRNRGRHAPEYELLDTDIFEDNRYFDIFIEYAKNAPDDILIRITIHNRGAETALLHLLPTLWFRNAGLWENKVKRPSLEFKSEFKGAKNSRAIRARYVDPRDPAVFNEYYFYCADEVPLLFTENETNRRRVFDDAESPPYAKDGIHRRVVEGEIAAVNPSLQGTKAAVWYTLSIPAGGSKQVRFRLTTSAPDTRIDVFQKYDAVFSARIKDADEFYQYVLSKSAASNEDRYAMMRQALSGMLWGKQFYYFDVHRWLAEHNDHSRTKGGNLKVRNCDWVHMQNEDILSMPDKWEYPWYAAWDQAFHAMAFSIVDPAFARRQIEVLLSGRYMHPNGQIPCGEWGFSDVNPPVHAWATLFLNRMHPDPSTPTNINFLKSTFIKLLLNFTWWVNRKDRFGKNVFEGGFLGLDNIGVFDRSAPLPTGGFLEQADGTAWMALFCQNMTELATELSAHDRVFDEMAAKFSEHFLWIAQGVNRSDGSGMWDEIDGFYYDILRLPDGAAIPLKVRSLVGLLPLCAVTVVDPRQRDLVPRTMSGLGSRFEKMPILAEAVHPAGFHQNGVEGRGIMALVNPEKLRRILTRMLDENEFLSPYGIRSLSKFHAAHPYRFFVGDREYRVDYEPGDSSSGMFGGNSNWRGPIWMPMNALLIRALLSYYLYYGNDFKIECPSGSGCSMNLFEVARELTARLTRIFLRGEGGSRPVHGRFQKFQEDPYWRDHFLFYEFFHGDTGQGLGASHQTGWTGVIAVLLQMLGYSKPESFLKHGFSPASGVLW